MPDSGRRHLHCRLLRRRCCAMFKQHAASPYKTVGTTSAWKIRIFFLQLRLDGCQTLDMADKNFPCGTYPTGLLSRGKNKALQINHI